MIDYYREKDIQNIAQGTKIYLHDRGIVVEVETRVGYPKIESLNVINKNYENNDYGQYINGITENDYFHICEKGKEVPKDNNVSNLITI